MGNNMMNFGEMNSNLLFALFVRIILKYVF